MKHPEEHKMFTPPQERRTSVSPIPLEPLGSGGQQLLGQVAADKETFMLSCKNRLTSLYTCQARDYDRVHGTIGAEDLGEGTQEGHDAGLDEIRSTGSGGSIGCGPFSHDGWEILILQ